MADARDPGRLLGPGLDRLIEDTFSRALTGEGLTRRHWQVLNTLTRGPASPAGLTTALDPFLQDDPAGQATTVDDLIHRGRASRDQDGRVCLTSQGQTARQMTQERVQQARGLVLRGLSTDEYAAVLGILARVAANLQTRAA
jgi:hypothetical protein